MLKWKAVVFAGAILNVKCFSRGLFGDQCCGMIAREKGLSKMLRRAKCYLHGESLFVSWRNANQEEKMMLKNVCFKCMMPFWFWQKKKSRCLALFSTPTSIVSCTHCLPMLTLMATKSKKKKVILRKDEFPSQIVSSKPRIRYTHFYVKNCSFLLVIFWISIHWRIK